jgi:probable addiction module antidote protein
MPKRTRPHQETVLKHLQDPRVAANYLNASLEDSDELFLSALKDVAKAHGAPLAEVAKKAGVKRESLHRMLNHAGNPTFESLTGVLRALGLRIAVKADIVESPSSRAKT